MVILNNFYPKIPIPYIFKMNSTQKIIVHINPNSFMMTFFLSTNPSVHNKRVLSNTTNKIKKSES